MKREKEREKNPNDDTTIFWWYNDTSELSVGRSHTQMALITEYTKINNYIISNEEKKHIFECLNDKDIEDIVIAAENKNALRIWYDSKWILSRHLCVLKLKLKLKKKTWSICATAVFVWKRESKNKKSIECVFGKIMTVIVLLLLGGNNRYISKSTSIKNYWPKHT